MPPASRPKSFQSVLEKGHASLGWTIARVPFDPSTVWKNMVRLRVSGAINGFAFRTSLFPDPRGGFYLLINRTMQQHAAAHVGDTADFTLSPDVAPREAELPDILATLLDQEPGLIDFYASLSEYTRREIGKWLLAPKSEASQLRRAVQTAERLLATMDAERQLPPAIEAAFRLRPKARTGWSRMTPAQRRGELLAVFHYQSVEARQRRIEKLCDAAEKHA